MKVLWILLVVQIVNFHSVFAQVQFATKKCCSSENNLLVNNKCVPDKNGKSFPIDLNCEKFVLDPHAFEDDRYNVTEAGLLLVHDLGSTILSDE